MSPTEPIIELTDAPTPELNAAITAVLTEYNKKVVPYDRRPLTIVVRDADGHVEGGIVGRTQWGWLLVEIFALPEGRRGQGLGQRLLQMAEDEARRRGCHHAYLTTMSWQAKPFYEKLGYREYGRLDDFPTGHCRHHMMKAL
jgi:GNAT superfamily N-acetyltransferase